MRSTAAYEKDASLEATEIQAALGHEITEAAVLRTLMDLWGGLRVMPVYSEDGPTRWELTQTRFEDALTAANKIAQTTGLSVLVALYLESVLAATPEEIETFLSPLTARSKVREVVNGLAATRQLVIVPVGTQTMYHVAGTLPEFAEPEPAPIETAPIPRTDRVRPGIRPAREERGPERRPSFTRDRAGARPRTGPPSRERFAAGGSERPPRRKPFGAGGGDRPPFRKFGEGGPRSNYPRREEGAGGERKPFAKRPFGQRSYDKPARPSEAGGAEERTEFRSGGGKFPPKKFGTGKFPAKKFGAPKKFGTERGKFPPKKFDGGKARPWKGGDARPSRPASSEGRPAHSSGRSGRSPTAQTCTSGWGRRRNGWRISRVH